MDPRAHGSQQGVLSEGGIIVESDGLAQRRLDPSEHRQHDRNGIGGGLSGIYQIAEDD